MKSNNKFVQKVDQDMRGKLSSTWTLVIVLMNILHIEVAIDNISPYNSELSSNSRYFGFCTLMAWWSL